jgi:hypothetical protein
MEFENVYYVLPAHVDNAVVQDVALWKCLCGVHERERATFYTGEWLPNALTRSATFCRVVAPTASPILVTARDLTSGSNCGHREVARTRLVPTTAMAKVTWVPL